MSGSEVTIGLESSEFAFAAAHMTILPDRIERIHGHNYTVRISASGRADDAGILVDFGVIKRAVRQAVSGLDNRLLIASRAPQMHLDTVGSDVVIQLAVGGGREYRLPAADAAVLDIRNTSVEELAGLIARNVLQLIGEELGGRVDRLCVRVAEMAGQWAEVCERVPGMVRREDSEASILSDEEGVALAVEAARRAAADGESPFGAVIARGSSVLVIASNATRSRKNPLRHAEVQAIERTAERGELSPGLHLYTSCEPCPLCVSAATYAGISRIVYGASLDVAIELGSGDPCIRAADIARSLGGPTVTGPLLEREATEVLRHHHQANGEL